MRLGGTTRAARSGGAPRDGVDRWLRWVRISAARAASVTMATSSIFPPHFWQRVMFRPRVRRRRSARSDSARVARALETEGTDLDRTRNRFRPRASTWGPSSRPRLTPERSSRDASAVQVETEGGWTDIFSDPAKGVRPAIDQMVSAKLPLRIGPYTLSPDQLDSLNKAAAAKAKDPASTAAVETGSASDPDRRDPGRILRVEPSFLMALPRPTTSLQDGGASVAK
jgi:hypothetical protein